MENSSKALLIAGSVLVGVLIVSFMTFLFSKVPIEAPNEKTVGYFNAQFEKYAAIDNNKSSCENFLSIVKNSNMKFTDFDKVKVVDEKGIEITNVEGFDEMKKYQISIVGYSDKGSINKIKIIEIK